jgi:hypothetical protein
MRPFVGQAPVVKRGFCTVDPVQQTDSTFAPLKLRIRRARLSGGHLEIGAEAESLSVLRIAKPVISSPVLVEIRWP